MSPLSRSPSQLPCRLSGAGSSNCAAVSRLISKKTQPTTRYGAVTLGKISLLNSQHTSVPPKWVREQRDKSPLLRSSLLMWKMLRTRWRKCKRTWKRSTVVIAPPRPRGWRICCRTLWWVRTAQTGHARRKCRCKAKPVLFLKTGSDLVLILCVFIHVWITRRRENSWMNSRLWWRPWTREPSPSSSWSHATPPLPSKANSLFRLCATSSSRRLDVLTLQSMATCNHSQPRQGSTGSAMHSLMCVCFSLIVFQITVHKGDECALLNNSQPFKWKVLNHSGHEAAVPSVCFMVPPVNGEAVDSVER